MGSSTPTIGGQKPLPSDGTRIDFDAYYTCERLARASVSAVNQYLQLEEGVEAELARGIAGRVDEHHVGGGAFARAVLDLTPAIVHVADIDPAADGLRYAAYQPNHRRPHLRQAGADFLTTTPSSPRPDWIVGNPPFDAALEHIEHALELTGRHALFVLQLAFAEAACRIPFWARSPARHVWACAQRPSFIDGGKTYGRPFALIWWDRQYRGRTTFTPCWDWHNQPITPTRRA
jgi:hypothetical protein